MRYFKNGTKSKERVPVKYFISILFLIAACDSSNSSIASSEEFSHVGMYNLSWEVISTECRHNLDMPSFMKIIQYSAGYPGGIEGELSITLSHLDNSTHTTFLFESEHSDNFVKIDSAAIHMSKPSTDADIFPAFEIDFTGNEFTSIIDYARRDSEQDFEWGCMTVYSLKGELIQ